MIDVALEAAELFPHKRLVVHNMQPHYQSVSADTTTDKEHSQQIDGDSDDLSENNVWGQMFTGELDLSRDELWSTYVESLEYPHEHVAELLDELAGKAVITANHRNYVGKRASSIPIQEYGHSRGVYDDPVVQVP